MFKGIGMKEHTVLEEHTKFYKLLSECVLWAKEGRMMKCCYVRLANYGGLVACQGNFNLPY